MAESDKYEPIHAVARLERNYADKTCKIHHAAIPNQEASFALKLIERFGTIEGRVDGEDSAGRQKLRMAKAAEVVGTAFELAELAFREIDRRAWLIDCPIPLAEVEATPEPSPRRTKAQRIASAKARVAVAEALPDDPTD